MNCSAHVGNKLLLPLLLQLRTACTTNWSSRYTRRSWRSGKGTCHQHSQLIANQLAYARDVQITSATCKSRMFMNSFGQYYNTYLQHWYQYTYKGRFIVGQCIDGAASAAVLLVLSAAHISLHQLTAQFDSSICRVPKPARQRAVFWQSTAQF